MPRRKTLLAEVFDILLRLSVIYVIFTAIFWFSDKPLFWKMLLFGLVFLASLIIIALFIKRSKIYKQSQWRTDRELLNWLRELRSSEFEKYIADLFTKLGYKTEATGGPYDEGVDVIAKKNGDEYYIQCKQYNNPVGVKEIREFCGALSHKLTNNKAFFITTNIFTEEAKRFATDEQIELIDGQRLIEYVRLAEKNNKENKLKVCPKCGGKLVERAGKYGEFYGCSNYPRCQYTENVKK